MPNVVVCVKPIPDPRHWDRLFLDPETGVLKRAGIPPALNPLDKNALEVALQLKERFGWEVTVVSMAPPDTAKALREALAMGADRVYLASDKALAGADTLATAYTLAQLIRKKASPFHLVICGNISLDGSTSQVPAQIAHYLGIPHITHATHVETEDGQLFTITMNIKKGELVFRCTTPFLLAVTKDVNLPRLVNVMGIIAAETKPLEVIDARELELDLDKVGLKGSPTRVRGLFIPEIKRRREILTGEPEEVAEELLNKLHEAGVL